MREIYHVKEKANYVKVQIHYKLLDEVAFTFGKNGLSDFWLWMVFSPESALVPFQLSRFSRNHFLG